MDIKTEENVSTNIFNKTSMAITLGNKATAVINGQSGTIDPALMFQCLVTIAGYNDDGLKSYFKY